MDNFTSILTYNTDTCNSWGMGEKKIPKEYGFDYVLSYATKNLASVIVRPSRGKFWYVKGLNHKKSYKEIKEHIEHNELNKHRPNTQLWLISYEENNSRRKLLIEKNIKLTKKIKLVIKENKKLKEENKELKEERKLEEFFYHREERNPLID